jgi:hypothetical protein
VILLMRLVAVGLALFALVMFAGSFNPAHPEERGVVLMLAAPATAVAVFLFVRARRMSTHDRSVVLNRKLLSLAQGAGFLTVAQVVAELSLTSDEAKAALTELSRDGLAEFDVDAEGAPIYRVRKLPSR